MNSESLEILNAIFDLKKTGCLWQYLPKDFPLFTWVSDYYQKWLAGKFGNI